MPPALYAVFGHPINHSKSPRIHGLFAQQTGQDICYTARDVPAERFQEELKRFAANGGKGTCNSAGTLNCDSFCTSAGVCRQQCNCKPGYEGATCATNTSSL